MDKECKIIILFLQSNESIIYKDIYLKGSIKLTLSYQHNKNITVKQIIANFEIDVDKNPREITDPEIQKDFLILEEQEGSINFKFGVLYAKHGQLTDDEMLSNGLFLEF